MVKQTGPGKFFIKVDKLPEVIRAWLFNFDIDGSTLKPEHTKLLDEAVGPVIRGGGAIKLLGLASTTGTVAHDRALSERRMHEVVNYLRTNFGSKFAVGKEIAFGKTMALAFHEAHLAGGTRDNQEAEVWRGVVINAWNRALPPPPPPGLDVPFNNSTWAETVDKVLDIASGVLGIIDLAADIADLVAVGIATGAGGLVIGVLQGIVAMPLVWAEADALAETNGEIQGAADAVQDMADQFANDKLDNTPISKWPSVKVPELHIPANPNPNSFQAAWRAGQSSGRQNAVQKVLDLEQQPKPITLPDGKNIRMSGRLWLRVVSKAFNDNAGVEIVIKPANEELRKRGRPPFPTH
jgi:hypothetical protein